MPFLPPALPPCPVCVKGKKNWLWLWLWAPPAPKCLRATNFAAEPFKTQLRHVAQPYTSEAVSCTVGARPGHRLNPPTETTVAAAWARG